MQKIREELQEMEDKQVIDINRLVVENDRAKSLIELFEARKTFHELPNDTTAEYNEGYVKAMCNAINRLKEIF